MQELIEFHFKPDVLTRFSLPDIGYPVPAELAPRLSNCGTQVPFDLMLFWLQHSSAEAGHDWGQVEPVMQRLIELLAPYSSQQSVTARGANWLLQIGAVFLTQQVVTIERDNCLLAALQPDEEGGLIAASYRPLDAESLFLLTRLAVRPHKRHGAAMSPNNWQYALDSTVSAENYYAAERGEPYLSYFKYGVREDEATVMPSVCTAAQLEIFSRLSATEH